MKRLRFFLWFFLVFSLTAGVDKYYFELGENTKVVAKTSIFTSQGLLKVYGLKSEKGEYYILAELGEPEVKASFLLLTGPKVVLKVGKEKACWPIDVDSLARGELTKYAPYMKGMVLALKEAYENTPSTDTWNSNYAVLYFILTGKNIKKWEKVSSKKISKLVYCDECDLVREECLGVCYSNFEACVQTGCGRIEDPQEKARCIHSCVVSWQQCNNICISNWARCKSECKPRPK